MERYQMLAAIIAAHPDHKVCGRTRLQKTIKLLQRLGAPLDYSYMIYFYGPYSEDLQSEIGLLENLDLIKENLVGGGGNLYYVLEATAHATPLADLSEIDPFRDPIETMSKTDTVILELAATYDAFKEMGANAKKAMEQLKRKKGNKCNGGNAEKAIKLLKTLGIN